MGDVMPNQTIYINNLYEKLQKEELKKCLHAIFSQFGRILDIVCLKTYRLRGQAWVVFADVTGATNALSSMQGFPFFDKPMRLQYAKTESDAVAKMKGVPLKEVEERKKKRKSQNATAREQMLSKTKDKGAPVAADANKPQAAAHANDAAPANKILFVQNLPEATNDMMLSMLFQQFPGFKEVRMVDARPGIAFVEFENEMQASVAMSGLQNFRISPQNAMQVTYAKQ
ncbi:hypothetical protein WJX72_006784 [[Myrmecia] bisecta]|uniref:RRM domain-containing protein n=1 Tax=[Myrmecia] bisecta TaxID=41462 RepID=A0AAW1PHI5_9CHLO